LVLWSTEVLTEGLPLLFGVPFSIVIFSIVIFIVWKFSANKHMDGWMELLREVRMSCRHGLHFLVLRAHSWRIKNHRFIAVMSDRAAFYGRLSRSQFTHTLAAA